jgi:hypothetical protein
MEEVRSQNPPVEVKSNSPKRLPGFVRFILVVLGILLVLSTIMALIGFDIYTVLFNPAAIQRRLASELEETVIIPAALAELSNQRAKQRIEAGETLSGSDEPDILLLLSYVKLEDWQHIQSLILPDEFVLKLISTALDGVYDWLKTDAASPQFSLDMQPMKTLLKGSEGEQAIMIAYAALPQCTQADVDDFEARGAKAAMDEKVLYNLCQFPDPYHDDQVSDYLASVKTASDAVPDQFKVGEGSQPESPADANQLRIIKLVLRTMRFLGHWGWVVPLLLAGIIIAIAVRSFRSLGNRIGIPLLISGAITLPLALVSSTKLTTLALQLLPEQLPVIMKGSVEVLAVHMIAFAFRPLLVGSIVVLAVGVVLLVLGLSIHPRKNNADKVAFTEPGDRLVGEESTSEVLPAINNR